jgi:hypothetical protein
MEESDNVQLGSSLIDEDPDKMAPFTVMKITVWVIISVVGLLILYSMALMYRLFKVMNVLTQKAMIQTILYIMLSLIFRLSFFICFEVYFYDQSIQPWKNNWYLTLILCTNSFTVLSLILIVFQW